MKALLFTAAVAALWGGTLTTAQASTAPAAKAPAGTRPALRRAARRVADRHVAELPSPRPATPVAPTAAAAALPGARPTVSVSGTVYGPKGRVLPGACVSLYGGTGPLAVANADGEFLLADVPATAVLHLQVEFQGLKPVQLDADVQHTHDLRVVLK